MRNIEMRSRRFRRKRAVFIVTSFWSHGELQIALDFANKFEDFVDPIFVIPQLHTDKVKHAGYQFSNLVVNAPRVNQLLLMDIETTLRPELVILADFMNYAFCYRHYGITNADLDIFSGSVCAFDIYNYDESGKKVDAYGYVAKHMSGLSLQRFQHIIQPVPVCPPGVSEDSRVFRYGLLPSQNPLVARQTTFRRKRNILIVGSDWQFSSGHPGCADAFFEYLKDRLCALVFEYSEEFEFSCLGYDISDGRDLGPGYKYLRNISSTRFDDYLKEVDCAIGFNYISTSLAKIVLNAIPVINIMNSYAEQGGKVFNVDSRQEWKGQMSPFEYIYPFKLFPVGWYRFLSHLSNNGYYDLMHDIEMFDLHQIGDRVKEVVLDGELHRQRVIGYLDRIAALDRHYDIRALGR